MIYIPEYVVEARLVAAGDISDFDGETQASLAAIFATSIGVDPNSVSVEIASASVEITFSVRAARLDYAQRILALLETQLATPALATRLLNGAVEVEIISEMPSLEVRSVVASLPPSHPPLLSCRGHSQSNYNTTTSSEELNSGVGLVAIACFSSGVLCSAIILPLAGELLPVTHRLWGLPILAAILTAIGLSAIIASDAGATRESAYARSYYEACIRAERWQFAIINAAIALVSLFVVAVRKILLRRPSICSAIRKWSILHRMAHARVAQAPPEPTKALYPPTASP